MGGDNDDLSRSDSGVLSRAPCERPPGRTHINPWAGGRVPGSLSAEDERKVLEEWIRHYPAPPPPPPPTPFVPGVNHAHLPSGRWSEVQADPRKGMDPYLALTPTALYLGHLCQGKTPMAFVQAVIDKEFGDKPIALAHLNWYLSRGSGRDFPEDDNIKDWLTRDEGIKKRLHGEIFDMTPPRRTRGHFEFGQSEFRIEDFHYAFGAIDRVDFEVDFGAGRAHVWFQDRYEWHPVYPGLYTLKSGDEVRQTNCLHAALVELKSSGAADFWMKGEARVQLSLIVPK
jgi:hypothetical protein